ncbi:MAG: transposase [Actinomycetota bacterium]|nr:transposase [Actinomycetota bacterium]
MPRLPRVFDPSLPYHVTTRGNDGRRIFADAWDRLMFMRLLERAVKRFELRCAGYCIMTTHYHMLFAAGVERLPAAMHFLNGGYAQAFNRRRGREHHVFGRRYAAIAIETDLHLLAAHRYLALNPVAAKLCERPADWPWSSYGAIAGFRSAPRLLDVDATLRLFATDRLAATARFRAFVEPETAGAAAVDREGERPTVPVVG